MVKKEYKWNNPHEWLITKIEREWKEYQLRSAIRNLLYKIDNDIIQDAFQDEMDADGYFD